MPLIFIYACLIAHTKSLKPKVACWERRECEADNQLQQNVESCLAISGLVLLQKWGRVMQALTALRAPAYNTASTLCIVALSVETLTCTFKTWVNQTQY